MNVQAHPTTKAPPDASPAHWPLGFAGLLDDSRLALLNALGDSRDVTFVRGIGNLGDELIWAGTRALFTGRIGREVGIDDLAGLRGHTAIVSGGGAWCPSYHETMPHILPLCEERFERVILLPSSFDTTAEPVRRALGSTRAVVFAREQESLRQAGELCGARLALDTAFFFDYTPWLRQGVATLTALRTDREARSSELAAGNVDISMACNSLDEWLSSLAGCAAVLTDRAHVMIAAAMLGKQVRYRPSNYHKLPAIAAFALRGFPVALEREPTASNRFEVPIEAGLPEAAAGLREQLLAAARRQGLEPPPTLRAASSEPRLTIAVVTRDRPAMLRNLLRSLREHVRLPFRLLVVDNNSAPISRQVAKAELAAFPAATLVESDRNLGIGPARQLAAQSAGTPLILFLDDDAEVFPETVEHLVAALDRHPEAVAAGPQVVLPSGAIQMCGGETVDLPGGILRFWPTGRDLRFGDAGTPVSRHCDWLGGMALLCRDAIVRQPLDPALQAYYEDTEWCYRMAAGGARFWFEAGALVLHHQVVKTPCGAHTAGLLQALSYLEAVAHFYRRHGKILEGAFVFAPGLAAADGTTDPAAARLLLELLLARGKAWVLSRWIEGDLRPLFDAGGASPSSSERMAAAEQRAQDAQAERRGLLAALGEATLAADDLRARLADAQADLRCIHTSRLWRLGDAYWRARGKLRRLARRGARR